MGKKYRKKPMVIEALQFFNGDGKGNTISECLEFAKGNAELFESDYYCFLAIKTLEGVMNAKDGDFIIKGVNGEFYPCKPDIFNKTYEEVK